MGSGGARASGRHVRVLPLVLVMSALALVAAQCEVAPGAQRASVAPAPRVVTPTDVTLREVAVELAELDRSRRPEVPVAIGDQETAAVSPVEWMAQLGLLNGTGMSPASPGRLVSRGDLAVMLHRFAGSPTVVGDAFVDVTEPEQAAAVAWMRSVGLTTGTSPVTFSPERPATRRELDVFVERLAAAPTIRVPYGVAHTIVDGVSIADPFIVPDGDGYILYATQEGWVNVPTWRSRDLVEWEFVGDALPTLPAWAQWGRTWAPDVFEEDGVWYLLFSARNEDPKNMCIGRAVATDRFGPFVADEEPVVCQHDRGGAIDPRRFTDDDGRTYLHWKSDDNHRRHGEETVLWAQEIDDTAHLIGPRVRLMGSDDGDHLGAIVESPQMVAGDGRYELTYSAGEGFFSPTQFIGTATCAGPLGPCTPRTAPLIASNDDGPGPGEHSLFRDHDGTIHVAYAPAHDSHLGQSRVLALAEVRFGPSGLEAVVPAPDAPVRSS